MLDFDTMLIYVGEFGLYQKILFAFQAPFCIFLTFVSFGPIFMQIFPDQFYCADRFNCPRLASLTPGQKQNLSFPYTGRCVDACFITDLNVSFLQEINQGQIRAENDICREPRIAMIDNENYGTQDCVHVYNGTFWYTELVDSAGHQNYQVPFENNQFRNYFQDDTTSGFVNRKRRPLYSNYDEFDTSNKGNTDHLKWGSSKKDYYNVQGYNSGGSQGYGVNTEEYWHYNSHNHGHNEHILGSGNHGWTTDDKTTTHPDYYTYNENRGNGYNKGSSTSQTTPGYFPYNYNPVTGQQFKRPGNNVQLLIPRTKPPIGNPSTKPPIGNPETKPPIGNPGTDNPPFVSSGNDKQFGGSEIDREFIKSGQKMENKGIDPVSGHQTNNICNERMLAQFYIKNTTRLALENITMSNKGRQSTPERTYNPRGQNHEACREIKWERSTPGNAARYYPTIITEGNWWCNYERITVTSQAIFFIGAIVGGVIFGVIADKWGRVPALVLSNLVGAIGGALSVISTDFWIYSFCRFLTGLSFDNCFTMMYIIVLEFCGPSYRTLVANLSFAIFYTLGTLILPWLALYLENWVTFGLAISLPMFLGLLSLFVVPESARWLLSKGKVKQATNILRRFAKVNRKKVDESIFVEFEEGAQKLYDHFSNNEEDPSVTEAFKTPRLRKTFILLILIWSCTTVVYDGHSRNILNLSNAKWNIYWMFTLGSLTEFPADILLILNLDRFGRRWLSFASLALSGVFSFVAATVPSENWTTALVMAIVSRFWANMASNIGMQYAAELLPTNIRAQGVNIIHIVGYGACMASPLIAEIGRTQPMLSLLLLGAVACIGGFLSLFLAETLGEELPNTLEEAEAFGKHQSFWNCPICAKSKPVEETQVEKVPDSVRLRNSLFRATVLGENRSSILSTANRSGLSRFGIVPNLYQPTTELSPLRRFTK